MIKKIFVLKDENENYVGSNSINFDKETNKYVYTYSEYLTNGFYTYQDKLEAEKALSLITDKGKEIKLGIKFHVDCIDTLETLTKESKMDIPRDPFVNIYFIKGLASIA